MNANLTLIPMIEVNMSIDVLVRGLPTLVSSNVIAGEGQALWFGQE
jgi:hypothetical protein